VGIGLEKGIEGRRTRAEEEQEMGSRIQRTQLSDEDLLEEEENDTVYLFVTIIIHASPLPTSRYL
jgi:hypothetical protein